MAPSAPCLRAARPTPRERSPRAFRHPGWLPPADPDEEVLDEELARTSSDGRRARRQPRCGEASWVPIPRPRHDPRVSSDAAWAACLHEKRDHEGVGLIPIKRPAPADDPTDRRCQAVSTNAGAVRARPETRRKDPCCTRPAKRASRHEQARTSQSLPACSWPSRTYQPCRGNHYSRSSDKSACVRQAARPHGLLPRLS